MFTYPRITLMAAIAAALFASGCGGGGATSSSGTDATLSHAQLVQRADAICRSYNHQLSERFRDARSDDQVAALWDSHMADFDRLIADLRKLRPAAADEAAYRAWVDAGARQRPLILAARPGTAEGAYGRLVMSDARVNAMADRMGMRDCAIDVDLTETPMTRSRYIQLANGECSSASAAFQLLPVPATVAEFDDSMRQMMPVVAQVQRDFRAMPMPDGDRDQLLAWLDARDRAQASIEAMVEAARTDDMSAFSRASKQTSARVEAAGRLAHAYGIDGCAS
jgi:hypothetical protein